MKITLENFEKFITLQKGIGNLYDDVYDYIKLETFDFHNETVNILLRELLNHEQFNIVEWWLWDAPAMGTTEPRPQYSTIKNDSGQVFELDTVEKLYDYLLTLDSYDK